MECRCKFVYKSEPVFIPNYNCQSTSADLNQQFVEVEQYECLCCGKKWGYIPGGSELIEKPKTIPKC